jgi:hypothetical protein
VCVNVFSYMKRFGNGSVMTDKQFMGMMLEILGDVVAHDTITVAFEVLSSIREGIKVS